MQFKVGDIIRYKATGEFKYRVIEVHGHNTVTSVTMQGTDKLRHNTKDYTLVRSMRILNLPAWW